MDDGGEARIESRRVLSCGLTFGVVTRAVFIRAGDRFCDRFRLQLQNLLSGPRFQADVQWTLQARRARLGYPFLNRSSKTDRTWYLGRIV
jgi:hypothetical protein